MQDKAIAVMSCISQHLLLKYSKFCNYGCYLIIEKHGLMSREALAWHDCQSRSLTTFPSVSAGTHTRSH